MPKRFLIYSRNEPARTILWSVAVLTGIMQTVAVIITGGLAAVPNLILVLALCGYGAWSAYTNNTKHMSLSSFWLCIAWLYSGFTRLFVASPDPTQLLWVPMIIVAVVLATVYINLSHSRKAGTDV